MTEFIEIYGQLGAAGVICVVFLYLIVNLISSQKDQTEDIDDIRQHQAKMETKVNNVESIIIKLIDNSKRAELKLQEVVSKYNALVKRFNDFKNSKEQYKEDRK